MRRTPPIRKPAVTLLSGLLLLLLTRPSFAADLDLDKRALTTSVSSGVVFTYELDYQCASTQENCLGVTITDALPSVLNWAARNSNNGGVLLTGSSDTVGTAYDPATGIATFDFGAQLAAGKTGTVSIQASFPHGTTPNGAVSSNSATIDGSNTEPVQATAPDVTAVAALDWSIDKALQTVFPLPALDQTVIYTITLQSLAETGGLDINDALLTDVIPANAEFVFASDGGSENGGQVTWNLGTLAAGSVIELTLGLRYPSTHFTTASVVNNSATLTGTHVTTTGTSPVHLPDSVEHGFTGATGGIGGFTKIPSRTQAAHGDILSYRIEWQHGGNVAYEQFSIEDGIPPEVRVNSIRAGAHDANTPPFDAPCPVAGRATETGLAQTIEYRSRDVTTWTPLPGSPFCTGAVTDIDVTGFLAGDDTIEALRWTFEAVPVGASMLENNTAIGFFTTVLETGRDDVYVVNGTLINNRADATASYADLPDSQAVGGADTLVVQPLANPEITKQVNAGSSVSPLGTSEYRIQIANPSGTDALREPVIADLLDEHIRYWDDNGTKPWFTGYTSCAVDRPNFSVVDNYNGTGRQLLRWSWEGIASAEFPPGCLHRLRFYVQTAEGTPPGTLRNQGSMIAPSALAVNTTRCKALVSDIHDLNGNGDTEELLCSSTADGANIEVVASPSLASEKNVRGQLDNAYQVSPSVALSVDGGSLEYRVTVTNTGNVEMTDVVLADILPHVGDAGVVSVNEARDSEWRPSLIGPVAAPAGVTVLYSTARNPCRGDFNPANPDADNSWPLLTNGAPSDCADPGWSTVPPTDITSVQSLRIEFNDLVIQPLDALQFSWPMQAPLRAAPVDGELASNSFGYYSTRVDTGAKLLPTEPLAVDIALNTPQPAEYGDQVWIDTNANGVQDISESGFDGVRVELYRYRGTGSADPAQDELLGFRLTSSDGNGDQGRYQFTDLSTGQYYARFIRPAGYGITQRNAPGSTSATDSDADPDTGLTAITTLETNTIDRDWDMGLVPSSSASVGDYVWFDRNGNGVQDESTLDGINGIRVLLFDNSSPGAPAQVDATVTADDVNGNPGHYRFEGLTLSTAYFVRFSAPSGAVFSPQRQGTDSTVDSDVDAGGDSDPFTPAVEGEYDASLDAGIVLETGPIGLGDRLWLDTNNNGVYEPLEGESGVDNVRLNLYRDDGSVAGQLDTDDTYYTATRTFTSNGSGYYHFDVMPDGDFIVQIDAAAFAAGGLLEGLSPSTGSGEPPPDPDNDIDDDQDQNGYAHAGGQAVVSFAITLINGDEPADDGTYNPTLDFGLLAIADAIELLPRTAQNPICTDHSVTATVTDAGGDPMADQPVDFAITTGPNAGATASELTDENGEAVFGWSSNGGIGTDRVTASVANSGLSALASTSWVSEGVPRCDANDDGQIDIDDVRAIISVQSTAASDACDQRDTDGNGTLTINDARACVLRCTNPRCAR